MVDGNASRPGVLGASLGHMMLKLGLEPDQMSQVWYGVPLARAIDRCLACKSKETCADWLKDRRADRREYCAFCPNAGLLDIARRE